MIVVKVGGSLYDHPHLGPGLRAYLDMLAPSPVLLVPGGGPFADAVRRLDAIHHLSEENAHWVALRSLSMAAEFLTRLISPLTEGSRLNICDPYPFAIEDEARPDHLPHSWDVTSDSLAARVAIVRKASRLVLLKSVDIPPGTTWADAAEQGWVDRHFPHIVGQGGLSVDMMNFRTRITSIRSCAVGIGMR